MQNLTLRAFFFARGSLYASCVGRAGGGAGLVLTACGASFDFVATGRSALRVARVAYRYYRAESETEYRARVYFNFPVTAHSD